MSDSAEKRRRWRWVAVVGVVVIVLGMIAWRFRPLNTTELALVGTWRSVDGSPIFQFDPDRRWEGKSIGNRGNWSANAAALTTTTDISVAEIQGIAGFPWRTRVEIFLYAKFHRYVKTIRFEGPDRLWLDSTEFTRVR